MKTYFKTYCLLIGVLLSTGIIYAGSLRIENPGQLPGNLSWESNSYVLAGFLGRDSETDPQKTTFYSFDFGNKRNISSYFYQEQSFALSQKVYRAQSGFYTHLKI
ncbi:MAG: hypothetical protein AB1432_03695 [Bacteroidota bacterium]|jgi:hypothetical protein